MKEAVKTTHAAHRRRRRVEKVRKNIIVLQSGNDKPNISRFKPQQPQQQQ